MTLMEMAKEIVLEQITANKITPDMMLVELDKTFSTLHDLQQQEGQAPEQAPGAKVTNWRKSITKHTITCLECGQTFRQLSPRHLRLHGLDSQSYRQKYGMPITQTLSSRQGTARRREIAQRIKPWEQAAIKRQRRH